MTICNMTIEGGGRAGMIAPDETTFEWVEGRPGAPEDFEAAVARVARAADRRRRRLRHRGRGRRRARSRRWSPGARLRGRWSRSRAPCPSPSSEPEERALRYMDLRAGPRDAGDRARPRLHRLLHELADPGPARGGFDGRGPQGRLDRGGDGRPGLRAGEGRGRGRGPRRGLPRRRLRLAKRRLLDVPRDEPRHPQPGRALRLDLEPQLRGPPGQGRPHPPGEPEDGRRGGDRGPFRRHPGVGGGARPDGAGGRDRGQGLGARPRRRRHRPDHPEAVPEAGRADRLRRVPLLRLDPRRRDRARAEPDPGHGPELRLRLVSRARPVGAPGLRLQGDHRARRSPTSSTATARRSGCCP